MKKWYEKDYELEIPERPYRIYWHGKFLRSYDNLTDLNKGLDFFKSMLICVTANVYSPAAMSISGGIPK